MYVIIFTNILFFDAYFDDHKLTARTLWVPLYDYGHATTQLWVATAILSESTLVYGGPTSRLQVVYVALHSTTIYGSAV